MAMSLGCIVIGKKENVESCWDVCTHMHIGGG